MTLSKLFTAFHASPIETPTPKVFPVGHAYYCKACQHVFECAEARQCRHCGSENYINLMSLLKQQAKSIIKLNARILQLEAEKQKPRGDTRGFNEAAYLTEFRKTN